MAIAKKLRIQKLMYLCDNDETKLIQIFRATRILNADFISKKNTSASS
jgi:hypothetical protein